MDRGMGNMIDTVEESIQNAILTTIHSYITPKIELAIRSINASSGRDATNVMASSERGEHINIAALLENVPRRNKTVQVLYTNDETRNKLLDDVNKLSVPDTNFDLHSPPCFPSIRSLMRSKSTWTANSIIVGKNYLVN